MGLETDWDTLLELYDETMRRDRASSAVERVERTPLVTRSLVDSPGVSMGAVLYSSLSAANADAVIGQQIEYFRSLGRPFEWKTYSHDRPADLGERLIAREFRPGERETVLVADAKRAIPSHVERKVRLQRIDTIEKLRWLERFDEAAGLEGLELRSLLATEFLHAPERISIWMALVAEQPVARAWARFYPNRPFAELWGGHTLPPYRGRGIYRSLVAARVAEARAKGAEWIAANALPTNRPILESLKFRRLVDSTPYLWVPVA